MTELAEQNRAQRFLARLLGVPTAEDVQEQVRQAAMKAFNEALEMSGEDEPVLYTPDGKPIAMGYKRIKETPRDLSQLSQERAIAASYRQWNTNPLGKALTEIKVDYVLGEGAVIQCEVDEVEQALTRFWKDPVNNMHTEGAEELVRELAMFGEQLLIAFVRDGSDQAFVADGLMRLGPVDPAQIASIITHPENKKDVLAVRLKDKNGALDTGPIYRVIRQEEYDGELKGVRDLEAYARIVKRLQADAAKNKNIDQAEVKRLTEAALEKEDLTCKLKEGVEWRFTEQNANQNGPAMRATEQKKDDPLRDKPFDGECFFFRINKISTGIRGRPDNLPLIDWLDRYDQVFFDGAEHIALLSTFVWDLLVEGGSEGAKELELNLRHQASKIQDAPPNSVYSHNEKTTLEAKNPDLRSVELGELVRSLRIFIAGGERIPEHWIAEGGYTNRATAREMGQPTYRMLGRRQAFVKNMLMTICQYQVDVLVALGHLKPEYPIMDEEGEKTDRTVRARDAFDIELPDINVEDVNRLSQAFSNIANAVFRLHTAGLIPLRPAVELLASISQSLGVEFDIDKIVANLEQQAEERRELAKMIGDDDDSQDDEDNEESQDDEE